jgi:hypothetical protein
MLNGMLKLNLAEEEDHLREDTVKKVTTQKNKNMTHRKTNLMTQILPD